MKNITIVGLGDSAEEALQDQKEKLMKWLEHPMGKVMKQERFITYHDKFADAFCASVVLSYIELDPPSIDPLSLEKVKGANRHFMSTGPVYLQAGWRADKGPQASNTSGFRAIGHRVLLQPEEVEKKTESGIVLVEKTVVAEENRAVICTVLEIGHDCWTDKSTDYCQVGDRVLVGTYTGKFHESPVDGKKYRFVMDTDVISPLPKVDA